MCRAHGTPAARSTVFICALSRKLFAGDRVHAGDAEVLPHLGQRDLQLLQDGQQPLHLAELAGQALHRGGDLAGVERVVDPPVPGQVLPERGRQPVLRLAGDQGQSARPGRRAAASTNRVVVSSR